MAFIKWTKDLDLNIEGIDDQHRKLAEMINEFYLHIQQKSNKDLVAKLIKEMREYSIVHFSSEEEFFKQYYIPEFNEHKIEHQEFVRKVADLEDRYNNNQLILSFEITNYLKTWLINHIKGSDAQYVNKIRMEGMFK